MLDRILIPLADNARPDQFPVAGGARPDIGPFSKVIGPAKPCNDYIFFSFFLFFFFLFFFLFLLLDRKS